MTNIKWNNQVKLIVSDVDETIADLYIKAEPQMIRELSSLLKEGRVIFFVTGQGLKSVLWRIVDIIPKPLRSHILIGHCSGAEVWGFDKNGNLLEEPYYSVYGETVPDAKKEKWRQLVKKVVDEFKLQVFPTMPVSKFVKKTKGNPLAIMLEDRGPQITFEVVNGYDLTTEQIDKLEVSIPETHGAYDLRIPILERADELFEKANLPITSRLGGVFAVDFAVKGVSKTTAIKLILGNEKILLRLGLNKNDIKTPEFIEIWGDKFSPIRGGTDRHMSEALPKKVRSIDFREEDPDEFLKGYNIVIWKGKKHLHHGLLEYLKARHE